MTYDLNVRKELANRLNNGFPFEQAFREAWGDTSWRWLVPRPSSGMATGVRGGASRWLACEVRQLRMEMDALREVVAQAGGARPVEKGFRASGVDKYSRGSKQPCGEMIFTADQVSAALAALADGCAEMAMQRLRSIQEVDARCAEDESGAATAAAGAAQVAATAAVEAAAQQCIGAPAALDIVATAVPKLKRSVMVMKGSLAGFCDMDSLNESEKQSQEQTAARSAAREEGAQWVGAATSQGDSEHQELEEQSQEQAAARRAGREESAQCRARFAAALASQDVGPPDSDADSTSISQDEEPPVYAHDWLLQRIADPCAELAGITGVDGGHLFGCLHLGAVGHDARRAGRF